MNKNNKIKILLADDDVTTRMLLRASITQWGFSVIEANDGLEAIAILQGLNPPSIVVSDWMMPNLDGIGLCMRVMETSVKKPYIILLTHNKGPINLVKAIESGADEFIEKPVNLEELRCKLIVAARIVSGAYATLSDESETHSLKGSGNEY